jgi:hypothetical protein
MTLRPYQHSESGVVILSVADADCHGFNVMLNGYIEI